MTVRTPWRASTVRGTWLLSIIYSIISNSIINILLLVTLISDLKTMLSPGGGLGVALLDDQDRLSLARCHLVTIVMVMAIMMTMAMAVVIF